jgi:hypothetical protein
MEKNGTTLLLSARTVTWLLGSDGGGGGVVNLVSVVA